MMNGTEEAKPRNRRFAQGADEAERGSISRFTRRTKEDSAMPRLKKSRQTDEQAKPNRS